MMRGRFKKWPLSVQMTILALSSELVLLALFSITYFVFSKDLFYQTFDAALYSNAEALSSLIRADDDGMDVHVGLPDKLFSRLALTKEPDLYAIMTEDGRILLKSERLMALPPMALRRDARSGFWNFDVGNTGYRGVVISSSIDPPDAGDLDNTIHLRVVYAMTTHELHEQMERIGDFLALHGGVFFLLSIGLAAIVAWKGLSPLRKLAKETRSISSDTLHVRLGRDGLPAELKPVADSINTLLGGLEKAFARERQFTSDAAHELRTPVATLKSGIQAALLEPPDSDSDRQVFHELLEDVERLEELCNALLLVASGQETRRDLYMPAGDWLMDISETIDIFRPKVERKGGEISLSIVKRPLDGAEVRSDPMVTRRIVSNLMENAIQYGGNGVRILVNVTWDFSSVFLCVQDNGPGVKPEDAPKLFERFFRTDSARSRTGGGAGLGLAICKSLAVSFSGNVAYEAASPTGSRFTWQVVLQSSV